MLLIVLALLGFSAVCFADPVLVARRFSTDHRRVAAARPVEPVFEVTGPNPARNAAAAWENYDASPRATFAFLGVRSCEWEPVALTE